MQLAKIDHKSHLLQHLIILSYTAHGWSYHEFFHCYALKTKLVFTIYIFNFTIFSLLHYNRIG